MSLLDKLIAKYASDNVLYEAGEIVRRADEVLEKWSTADDARFPQLYRQTAFLFDFVRQHFGTSTPEEKRDAFAEAVYAVKYAIDPMDFVPDFLPGIGKADDSAIVCEVLNRNAAIYQVFAAEQGVDWAEITPRK